jgi:uncharacterized caspase-like protein
MDMARGLRQLGFEVMELRDADHQRMEEGVEQFTRQLGRGGVGLFYYSGHGVQVSGLNYLIPVDARITARAISNTKACRSTGCWTACATPATS